MRPTIRALLCLATAVLMSAPALARRCTVHDSWHGPDKTEHLLIGAAAGMAGAFQFESFWHGVAAGALVGVTKEALDATGLGTCSLQDALVTVAGGVLGAATGGVMLTYSAGKTTVWVVRSF